MDIGCYPISLSRFIFDAEPTRVLGLIERDPNTQIDRLTSGVLEFFQGTATFTCATQLVPYQRVNIFGTVGPDRDRDSVQRAARSAVPHVAASRASKPGAHVEEIRFDMCDQYTLQADAFARAIMEDTPVPTPLADAVANMRVIERVLASAEKERVGVAEDQDPTRHWEQCTATDAPGTAADPADLDRFRGRRDNPART